MRLPQNTRRGPAVRMKRSQRVADGPLQWRRLRPVDFLLILFGFYAFNSFEIGNDSALADAVMLSIQLVFLSIAFYVSKSWLRPQGFLLAIFFALYILLLNITSVKAYAIVSIIAIFATLSVSGIYLEASRRYFASIIGVILAVHVLGLCFQAAAYFASGSIVDIHQMIFPASKARMGAQLGVFRWSGFFIEPGTYSHWIYALVVLRAFLLRRIFDPISLVAVASFALTLSAWGIVAALVYGIAVGLSLILARLPSKAGRLMVVLVASMASLLVVVDQQQQQRSVAFLLPAPVAERMSSTDGTYRSRVIAGTVFGQRLREVVVFGRPISDPFCASCKSAPDLGVWSMLTFHFGLIPALGLGCLFAWGTFRLLGMPGVIIAAPLVLTKISFFDPLLWLLIGASFAALSLLGSRQALDSGPTKGIHSRSLR
jgi:hypothetical protein